MACRERSEEKTYTSGRQTLHVVKDFSFHLEMTFGVLKVNLSHYARYIVAFKTYKNSLLLVPLRY